MEVIMMQIQADQVEIRQTVGQNRETLSRVENSSESLAASGRTTSEHMIRLVTLEEAKATRERQRDDAREKRYAAREVAAVESAAWWRSLFSPEAVRNYVIGAAMIAALFGSSVDVGAVAQFFGLAISAP